MQTRRQQLREDPTLRKLVAELQSLIIEVDIEKLIFQEFIDGKVSKSLDPDVALKNSGITLMQIEGMKLLLNLIDGLLEEENNINYMEARNYGARK